MPQNEDEKLYTKAQEDKFIEHEAKCLRCGYCCGAFSTDPCSHIKKDLDGKYLCDVYENRIGPQLTMSGKIFNCIPIRVVLNRTVSYPDCGYNK